MYTGMKWSQFYPVWLKNSHSAIRSCVYWWWAITTQTKDHNTASLHVLPAFKNTSERLFNQECKQSCVCAPARARARVCLNINTADDLTVHSHCIYKTNSENHMNHFNQNIHSTRTRWNQLCRNFHCSLFLSSLREALMTTRILTPIQLLFPCFTVFPTAAELDHQIQIEEKKNSNIINLRDAKLQKLGSFFTCRERLPG